jgi:hypothetical protein
MVRSGVCIVKRPRPKSCRAAIVVTSFVMLARRNSVSGCISAPVSRSALPTTVVWTIVLLRTTMATAPGIRPWRTSASRNSSTRRSRSSENPAIAPSDAVEDAEGAGAAARQPMVRQTASTQMERRKNCSPSPERRRSDDEGAGPSGMSVPRIMTKPQRAWLRGPPWDMKAHGGLPADVGDPAGVPTDAIDTAAGRALSGWPATRQAAPRDDPGGVSGLTAVAV